MAGSVSLLSEKEILAQFENYIHGHRFGVIKNGGKYVLIVLYPSIFP